MFGFFHNLIEFNIAERFRFKPGHGYEKVLSHARIVWHHSTVAIKKSPVLTGTSRQSGRSQPSHCDLLSFSVALALA
jgi:hypothetical protein